MNQKNRRRTGPTEFDDEEDPLDFIGGGSAQEEQDEQDEGGPEPEDSDKEPVRMTFYVDHKTAERLRNAVYWTGPITLSGVARSALQKAVEALEAKYNDGEPFPERGEDLQGGRPVGS